MKNVIRGQMKKKYVEKEGTIGSSYGTFKIPKKICEIRV